jgi:hypothetical protein
LPPGPRGLHTILGQVGRPYHLPSDKTLDKVSIDTILDAKAVT